MTLKKLNLHNMSEEKNLQNCTTKELVNELYKRGYGYFDLKQEFFIYCDKSTVEAWTHKSK